MCVPGGLWVQCGPLGVYRCAGTLRCGSAAPSQTGLGGDSQLESPASDRGASVEP